jgi:hypothetical protein
MPFVVGGYTELGFGTPQRSFERVLDSVLKPILTLMYHRKDACFCLALSGAMVEWLEACHPEVNMLVSDLVKKNQLSMVGGTYYQGVLSLLPSKDRSGQIEKSTTMIRLTYGQRTDTMFCYGQVFSPYFLHTTALCGIRNLLIVPGDECDGPFVMHEQDKAMTVFPIDAHAALLTSRLAEQAMAFPVYLKEMGQLVEEVSKTVLLLNLDQLCKAGVPPEAMTELCNLLFSRPTDHLSSFEPVIAKGYQCDGWFGYDAVRPCHGCFNSLFIHDQSLSYLYNRYSTLLEISKTHKKTRDVKKQMEKLLLSCGMGNPFVMDADASTLRPSVRQLFYHHLAEAQVLLDSGLPEVYDFDRDGYEEYSYVGKNFLAVISPLGGAISELVHLPTMTNYGSAFVPLEAFGVSEAKHSGKPGTMLRLFSDVLCKDIESVSLRTDEINAPYQIDDGFLSKGEFTATYHGECISIVKRYKFRQNTVLVDVQVTNVGNERSKGWYGLAFPVSVISPKDTDSVSCSITDTDHKTRACVERSVILQNIRSARLFVGPTVTMFSSTPCTLVKEDHTIETKTVQQDETILLDVLLLPSFPLDNLPGETRSFTLGLRVEKK